MTPSRLYRFLYTYWWLSFLLMGICFVLFGLMSLNLVQTVMANFEFLSRYGRTAVAEGALHQLAELAISGYAAAAFYLGFKLCEKALIDRASTAQPAADSSGKGWLGALGSALMPKRPRTPPHG